MHILCPKNCPCLKNSGCVTQATPLSSIKVGSLNWRGTSPSSSWIILPSFSFQTALFSFFAATTLSNPFSVSFKIKSSSKPFGLKGNVTSRETTKSGNIFNSSSIFSMEYCRTFLTSTYPLEREGSLMNGASAPSFMARSATSVSSVETTVVLIYLASSALLTV